MDNQVKIELIKLKIGSQEVEVTVEQARELSKILNDLFKTPPQTTIYREFVPVSTTPWITWTQPQWEPNVWKAPEVICGPTYATNGTSTLFLETKP